MLYQLSYSREADDFSVAAVPAQRPGFTGVDRSKRGHGGEGDRTPDLVNAIHALSQLSYAPARFSRPRTALQQHGNVARVTVRVNEAEVPEAEANLFVPSIIRPR